jgi:hypothetical protein
MIPTRPGRIKAVMEGKLARLRHAGRCVIDNRDRASDIKYYLVVDEVVLFAKKCKMKYER